MAIANDGENLYPTTKDTITTYYFTYCFDDVFYSHILLQVDFNALSYEVTDYKWACQNKFSFFLSSDTFFFLNLLLTWSTTAWVPWWLNPVDPMFD